MTNHEELKRLDLERTFREYCEKLKRNDELGMGLRPQDLQAMSAPVNHADLRGAAAEFDRNAAPGLLKYVESARKDFPALSKEYSAVLSKAEESWKSLAV